MLSEERLNKIVAFVNAKKTVTMQELIEEMHASESTIRRDLGTLDSAGRLTKVFGGAIARNVTYSTKDDSVVNRQEYNKDEKIKIAKYAASLIEPDDFVYMDAGTTNECMIPFIPRCNAVFVTNGFSHAKELSEAGFQTYIIGGEIKLSTESVVGGEALMALNKYNFTKGFWGANGISIENGFSTPDVREAMVKKTSMARTLKRYVLADSSKFAQISCVTFADFTDATIITAGLDNKSFADAENIINI